MKRNRSNWYSIRRKAKIDKQSFLRQLKSERGCKDCGYKEHVAALQFHHRNPKEKKFALARCENFSWDAILKEIEKCDILCANCHAIHEFKQKKVNQTIHL